MRWRQTLRELRLRKQKREGEKERSRERGAEKAGGNRVSPEEQSRRSLAFTKQQRLVRLPTARLSTPKTKAFQFSWSLAQPPEEERRTDDIGSITEIAPPA
ncbi:hypothetical protein CMV_005892 [Castanea mollissima]|uniref:Uncharacterized protein n=1 Tax=Castanea mollissima TaxID=60419 RepID=A0A8J4RBQ2_9ROSI|nr:hypothetical protein CMV_005892 [Castanea mollissima]